MNSDDILDRNGKSKLQGLNPDGIVFDELKSAEVLK